MVSDLNKYRSHEHKKLADHISGVILGTQKRTSLRIAEIAAIFHDLGKLNPHFQAKLPNSAFPKGNYSNHSCLSAYAFLCFVKQNSLQYLRLNFEEFKSVIALIAHHHGNLPNFADGILSIDEREKMTEFLNSSPELPISELLSQFIPHKSFDMLDSKNLKLLDKFHSFIIEVSSLQFFLDTQFGFASLIESDKRDASDNDSERRANNIVSVNNKLSLALNKEPDSAGEKQLNKARSDIRIEAMMNLQNALDDNKRVFCLTAPTGAGKTLTLLSLFNLILNFRNSDKDILGIHGLIYCLPFLSITEQVADICAKLLDDKSHLVLRADSAASHPKIDKLLKRANDDPQAAKELLKEDFAELTFDSPFVITTFVQFFETLMSNRNSALLKLPNFAKSIIILDEIQALPPRLYVFFAAYLDAFCKKFDSYVIISTATMPSLKIPTNSNLEPEKFFPDYTPPIELVGESHFQQSCFDRYIVRPSWDTNSIDDLKLAVMEQAKYGKSILIVLNTICDTRELYAALNPDKNKPGILLLNTLFTPKDRRKTIARCHDLDKKPPIILITTQLIEAGVDIDFPVVFRDLCPFPNLVQAAGRCNRNNRLIDMKGQVILVNIKKNEKSRAATIYQVGIGSWFLDFTVKSLVSPMSESEVLKIQDQFFDEIKNNLEFGSHPKLRDDVIKSNLLLCMQDAAFQDVGKFKLIHQEGEHYSFYIPNTNDNNFETLGQLAEELSILKRNVRLSKSKRFQKCRQKGMEIEEQLRKMRDSVVQARMSCDEARLLGRIDDSFMGITLLEDIRNYTTELGLKVSDDRNFC